MKKHSFAAGMLTMALIGGLGFSALAATGQFTITVDPVNIQVNGTTFAPKDAKGNDVPVFAYGGTTYAPLRALAEVYGLTVGYDGTANMATVASAGMPSQPPGTTAPPTTWSAEDEAAYQEFKGLWEVELINKSDVTYHMDGSHENAPWESYKLTFKDTFSRKEINDILNSANEKGFLERLAHEIRSSVARVDMNICDSSGMSLGFQSVE